MRNPLRPYGCGPRVLFACLLVVFALAGCDRTRGMMAAPSRYLPAQQYDKTGKPCMKGGCAVINEPRMWLKTCR